ncbi:MAG: hypothetical protein LBT86_07635 [Deltaproteobacteria bacterium]|jgi:hypothetical protein|nr:hypothetical protein [Deltaproteobacteria bacterium]
MIIKILEIVKSQMALFLAIALTTTLASSCAGRKTLPKLMVVKHYPACYRHLDDLRKVDEEIKKDLAYADERMNILKPIIYAQSDDDKAEALKRAVKRGLTRNVLFLLVTSQVQAMEQNQRFQLYYYVIDTHSDKMEKAAVKVKNSSYCYQIEHKNMAKNYKAGRFGEAEMNERLTEIKGGTSEAQAIIQYYYEGTAMESRTIDELINRENNRPDKANPQYLNQLRKRELNYAAQVVKVSNMVTTLSSRMKDYNQKIVAHREIN